MEVGGGPEACHVEEHNIRFPGFWKEKSDLESDPRFGKLRGLFAQRPRSLPKSTPRPALGQREGAVAKIVFRGRAHQVTSFNPNSGDGAKPHRGSPVPAVHVRPETHRREGRLHDGPHRRIPARRLGPPSLVVQASAREVTSASAPSAGREL